MPLDARFGQSEAMKQLMVDYQGQLKEEGFERLGLLPRPTSNGAKFVGSKTCADCHTKAYEVWEKTPHAHALATLEKVDPQRQFDPECLSCHVTGWNPKDYVPYVSGFTSREKTPLLADNGCENCHGPGSAHVAAEGGNVAKGVLDKLRAQMRLTKAEASNPESPRGCARCHDGDNSPNYTKMGFDHYWPKVEHHGKD